jgi:hypothetical protein
VWASPSAAENWEKGIDIKQVEVVLQESQKTTFVLVEPLLPFYLRHLAPTRVHNCLFPLTLLNMAPQRWANREQTTFLESRRADYLKHQADGKLPRFWAQIHEEWFVRWSERDRLHPREVGEPERVLNSGEQLVLRKAILDRKNVSFVTNRVFIYL